MIDGVADGVPRQAQLFRKLSDRHPLPNERGFNTNTEIVLPVTSLWFTSVHRQLPTRLEQLLTPSTIKMGEKADFSQRVIAYRKREDISQEELAKRLGISRNYVSMIEGGKQPSEQVVRHFALLESSPLPAGSSHAGSSSPSSNIDRAKETSPDYDLMKKVIFIEEQGTPEQLALIDAFLDKICEQLGFDRGRKPDRESQGKSERS